MNHWHCLAILSALNLTAIGIGEILHHYKIVSAMVSRKIVHFLVGIIIAVTPLMVNAIGVMYALGIIFFLFNIIAKQAGWFPGMHQADDKSWGTVYFVVGYLIVLWWCLQYVENNYLFTISFLVLACGDSAAALIGSRFSSRSWLESKTIYGSISLWLITFFLVMIILPQALSLERMTLIFIAILTSFAATAIEVLCRGGLDNATLPITVALILTFAIDETTDLSMLATGFFISGIFSMAAFKIGSLSSSGATSAFLLGAIVFGTGGQKWGWPLATFFILSSALGHIAGKEKTKMRELFEKGERRDRGQVFANGGVAGFCALMAAFWPFPIFYACYIAALAAACADTWATEIGTISGKWRTILITSGKSCPPGMSGGVSIPGSFGALLGAFSIFFCTWIIAPEFIRNWGLCHSLSGIVGAGFIASLFDSLLGAKFQGQYQCSICRKVTEKKKHCQVTADLKQGYLWIGNDQVNFSATCAGAFIAALIWNSTSLLI